METLPPPVWLTKILRFPTGKRYTHYMNFKLTLELQIDCERLGWSSQTLGSLSCSILKYNLHIIWGGTRLRTCCQSYFMMNPYITIFFQMLTNKQAR